MAIASSACQKELPADEYKSCLADKIQVFENGAQTAAETYEYFYNAETLLPTAIYMEVKSAGYQKNIPINFDGTKASLGSIGFIELDGSGRVTHLQVNEAYPGADKGDYFYGYNISGFLEERLFDDGSSMIERTRFTNDGNGFKDFTITYESDPSKVNGSVAYLSSPVLKTDVLFPYADLFPELLPFMVMVKLGQINATPPGKIEATLESPGVRTATLTYTYTNYTVNSDEVLTAFTGKATVPGLPAFERRFSIANTCK